LDRRAGTIQPLAYVRGLATAAIAEGAEIHRRSPALRREDQRSGWRIYHARQRDGLVDTRGGRRLLQRHLVAAEEGASFNLATRLLDLVLRSTALRAGRGANCEM